MLKAIYTFGLLVFAGTISAQNFEGVINLNTTNAELDEKASVTWYLKGDRSRMDISSQAGEHSSEYSIIVDGKGMHMVAQGHVTEIPQAAMKAETAAQTRLSETDGETVNGYSCTRSVYFDGSNRTIYWLTNDLEISFNDIPAVIKRNMPNIKSSGFPIKMEKRNSKGEVLLSQEVTAVSATSVDESRFKRN